MSSIRYLAEFLQAGAPDNTIAATESTDTAALATTVTTGVAVAAVESADSAAIFAQPRTLTFYLKDAAPSGASGLLSLQEGGTAPTAATSGTGWATGTIAVPGAAKYQLMQCGSLLTGSGFFTSPVEPASAPNGTDCFRSENAYTGTFANSNWVLVFGQHDAGVGGPTDGTIGLQVRIWRSTSPTGVGATELTSAAQSSNTTTGIAYTETALTVTWTPGATFALNGEYLFVQVAAKATVSVTAGLDLTLMVGAAYGLTTPQFSPSPATTGVIAATESADSAALAASPTTGATISVGGAIRNLFTFTEQFDNAAWTKYTGLCSVTANATTAPDGTSTADKLVEVADVSSYYHTLRSAAQVTIPDGSAFTFSCYVKAVEITKVYLHLEGSFFSLDVFFDLSAGTVGTATGCTGTITAVGSGWYRCSMSGTNSSGSQKTPDAWVGLAVADGNMQYVASGSTNGLYIWGAQFEVGTLTAYQAIPAVDYSDTAAISAAEWITAQLAALESPDSASLTTTVTTGAALGATDSADAAALTAADWMTAQIAATESPDTANLTAANWVTAQLAALESADNAALTTEVTTAAPIAATEAADSASIVADANLSVDEGVIVATEAGDNAALTTSVGTGAAIAATEAPDSAALLAANWATAQLAANEVSDNAAISGSATIGTAIGVTESADAASLTAANQTTAQIGGTESPDNASLIGLAAILVSLGVTDAADIAAITARITTGAFLVASESSDVAGIATSSGRKLASVCLDDTWASVALSDSLAGSVVLNDGRGSVDLSDRVCPP